MSPARHALIIETGEAGKSHGINRIHWIETDVLVRGFAYCDTREPNGMKAHISGQFLPDLLWCHGESFESRHDSFCTMKTGAASVFCEAWSPLLEPCQIRASGRSQVSQIRTKRKMRQYPSGRESLVEQTTPMKHWPVNIHFRSTGRAR